MKSKLQRTLAGRFSVETTGGGAWVLTNQAPPGETIVLRGVREAPRDLADASAVSIDWRDEDVLLRLRGAGEDRILRAAAALLHEPRPDLYRSLPLAEFDADARRFWRRVFGLVRLPGGRVLLGFLARLRRSG